MTSTNDRDRCAREGCDHRYDSHRGGPCDVEYDNGCWCGCDAFVAAPEKGEAEPRTLATIVIDHEAETVTYEPASEPTPEPSYPQPWRFKWSIEWTGSAGGVAERFGGSHEGADSAAIYEQVCAAIRAAMEGE